MKKLPSVVPNDALGGSMSCKLINNLFSKRGFNHSSFPKRLLSFRDVDALFSLLSKIFQYSVYKKPQVFLLLQLWHTFIRLALSKCQLLKINYCIRNKIGWYDKISISEIYETGEWDSFSGNQTWVDFRGSWGNVKKMVSRPGKTIIS